MSIFHFDILDEKFLAGDDVDSAFAGAAFIETAVLVLADRAAEAQWQGCNIELGGLGKGVLFHEIEIKLDAFGNDAGCFADHELDLLDGLRLRFLGFGNSAFQNILGNGEFVDYRPRSKLSSMLVAEVSFGLRLIQSRSRAAARAESFIELR